MVFGEEGYVRCWERKGIMFITKATVSFQEFCVICTDITGLGYGHIPDYGR
jgi:hypothetical protein